MQGDEPTGSGVDFRDVVEALPGLVWTTFGDGRCSYANAGWSAYTGLTVEATLGQGWQAAIHPDDRAAAMQAWSEMKPRPPAAGIDARLRRSDGEYRWFVLHPAPLPAADGQDERWCWLGSFADESPTTDGRVRRLFDMLPIQAGFLDSRGVLEFTNRQSLADFDMTKQELEAWTTSGIIHVDDHESTSAAVAALLATGERYDQELRMLHPDGHYRWTRAQCVPWRDAQGNVVRYVSFQIDVDDLRQAEALLAAEVRVLEMVARGEPLGRVVDAVCRGVESLCRDARCNLLIIRPGEEAPAPGVLSNLPAACRQFLERPENLVGDNPYALAAATGGPVLAANLEADPRWRGSAWKAMMDAAGLGSCCVSPVASASGPASGILMVHRSDGAALRAAEQRVVDRFAKIAGIALDRSEADIALRSSERELREALAQLAEGQRISRTGSFTSDIQQDRHHWSDEFYRIFEIEIGTPPQLEVVRGRIHPDDLPLYDSEIQRGLEGGGSDFDFRIVTPVAGLKHLRGVAQLMELRDGRPIFMGAVQDVSESKRAEDALTRARTELAHVARVTTLNAMTASIAHEVSQPLSGILTNANTCARMLERDPPDLGVAAEAARRAIRDANRAAEVISRLRAMFSTRAPALEPADLNEVAREVIAISGAELRRSGAQLRTDFADALPPVHVDRVQLQQVILNLLLNAADAMADVTDRAKTLQMQTRFQDDGTVRLAVSDIGVGFAPGGAERLFDAFYTTKPRGMGVGLSISRAIIERHAGRLWAEANAGPGATFIFSLPPAQRTSPRSA